MGIPLQAQVECTDGVCGLSVCVLMDPRSDQVVHVVVKESITNRFQRWKTTEMTLYS